MTIVRQQFYRIQKGGRKTNSNRVARTRLTSGTTKPLFAGSFFTSSSKVTDINLLCREIDADLPRLLPSVFRS